MLPQLLLHSLAKAEGFDKTAFEAVHNSADAVTSIRVNPDKKAKLDFNSETRVPWCEHGAYLSERPSFIFDPLWHAGSYYVQEASSMFIWNICQQLFLNETKKFVLDACAAPGGKTTLLSSFFKDGLVVSNEIIKSRATILNENVTKWGTNNVVITNNEVEHFKIFDSLFDAIFIDAPCSGSGLFRKDKEAINHWSESAVEMCSLRQKKIITNLVETLKPGGYLVYSTCSYSPEENEQVVDWLIENHDFTSIDIKVEEHWKVVSCESETKKANCYRFYPYLTKGEGFFISVLKKSSNGNSTDLSKSKFKKLIPSTKDEISVVQPILQNGELFKFINHNNQIIALPIEWFQHIEFISQHLYIKKVGTIIGELKHKELIPSHDLALSTIKNIKFNYLEVDKQTAIKYLQRKEISIDTIHKGWVLLNYCEMSIGWIKVLPNRINNYYPKEWRILKEYF